MWGIITIRGMTTEGIEKAARILENDGISDDAIEMTIKEVEDFPYYKSIGYSSLPNERMEVELGVAHTGRITFGVGAITAVKGFTSLISIARRLSKENINNLLVGEGAEKFVYKEDFERKNILSDRAKIHYKNRVKDVQELEIEPYSEHDMVGMAYLDSYGDAAAATSTSGLFMKKKGRVGDFPTLESGFYVDSRTGGTSVTRLSKDLIKGCISYEIARLTKEGRHPQEACDIAISQLDQELTKWRSKTGGIPFVAISSKGEWGVVTNIEGFSFVVAMQTQKSIVYVTKKEYRKYVHEEASSERLENYMSTCMAPLIEK